MFTVRQYTRLGPESINVYAGGRTPSSGPCERRYLMNNSRQLPRIYPRKDQSTTRKLALITRQPLSMVTLNFATTTRIGSNPF